MRTTPAIFFGASMITLGLAVGGSAAVKAAPPSERSAQPQEEPFQNAFDLSWANGQNWSATAYVVPPGKRAVIELVTINASFGEGVDTIFVVNTAGGVRLGHALPSSQDGHQTAVTLRLYADPGTSVEVVTFPIGPTQGTISGYLLPAESTQ